MKNLNATQTEQVEALFKHYGRTEVSRSEINNFVKSGKISNPSWLKNDKYKVSRGVYSLPIEGNDFSPTLTDVPLVEETPNETVNQAAFVVSSLVGNIVPEKDPVFVPWGYFKDIKKIVTSKQFYPIFVTGLSGNGKTMNVTLKVYNINGQLVRTLVNAGHTSGTYQTKWNGKDNKGLLVPSGLYIYRYTAGNFIKSHKMMLVK